MKKLSKTKVSEQGPTKSIPTAELSLYGSITILRVVFWARKQKKTKNGPKVIPSSSKSRLRGLVLKRLVWELSFQSLNKNIGFLNKTSSFLMKT